MDPQQVAASYDRLAPHWAGPAFDHSNGIPQHERALQFTEGHGRALDVGCGSRVFIFTTGGVENPSETTNPCRGQPMYHAAMGISGVLRTISEAGCVCRHLEYDHYPEPHVYLIVQRI